MTSAAYEPAIGGRMVDLGRYRRAAVRRWPWIVLLAILGGAAGGYLLPSAKFESSAVIQVKNGLVDLTQTGATGGAPNMSTEQQVASSASVVGQALEGTPGGFSVSQFQARGTVSSPPDSTTLTLTFTGDTAEGAQEAAQAWADAYLNLRDIELGATLKGAAEQLSTSVDDLQDQLDAAQQRIINTTAGTVEARRAEASVRLLVGQLRSAQGKLRSLDSVVVDPGRIIGNPIRPAHPSGLTLPYAIAIGALTGALLGLVLALVAERFQQRIRDARDVSRGTAAPVWAVIEASHPGAVARAYDALAARLLLAARHSGLHSVLITCVDKSALFAAVQLAQGVERLGHRVRITDDVEALLEPKPATAGTRALDPDGMETFLIVGAPPLLVDPRTAVLSSEADVTLLVAEVRDTKVSQLERAEDLVEATGGRISGVLLTHSGSQKNFPPGEAEAMIRRAAWHADAPSGATARPVEPATRPS